jgi:hypothetical protein
VPCSAREATRHLRRPDQRDHHDQEGGAGRSAARNWVATRPGILGTLVGAATVEWIDVEGAVVRWTFAQFTGLLNPSHRVA